MSRVTFGDCDEFNAACRDCDFEASERTSRKLEKKVKEHLRTTGKSKEGMHSVDMLARCTAFLSIVGPDGLPGADDPTDVEWVEA